LSVPVLLVEFYLTWFFIVTLTADYNSSSTKRSMV